MSREWKPGDVALAFNDDIQFRVVRHAGGDGPDYWSAANGTYPMVDAARSEHLNYRPLVVVDSEDRKQVEALRDLMDQAWDEQNSDHGFIDIAQGKGQRGNAMQAALREFANPTALRHDEPTGLGAVVEDGKGVRWTRVKDGLNWRWRDDRLGEQTAWEYLVVRVVRVLSEGVQP